MVWFSFLVLVISMQHVADASNVQSRVTVRSNMPVSCLQTLHRISDVVIQFHNYMLHVTNLSKEPKPVKCINSDSCIK